MITRSIVLTCALLALGGGVLAAAADNGPSVTVMNFPLDQAGSLRTSGQCTVSGTVGATQTGPWSMAQGGAWSVGQAGAWSVGQAGSWSVALGGAAATALGNIDAATAGLRYDGDGNLKVSVGGGSPADPTPATRSPFGYSAFSSFTGTVDVPGTLTNLTAYSFHSDHNMLAVLSRPGTSPFGIYVAANQPAVGSFAHAIPTDGLSLQCLNGATCTVLISAAGY